MNLLLKQKPKYPKVVLTIEVEDNPRALWYRGVVRLENVEIYSSRANDPKEAERLARAWCASLGYDVADVKRGY